MGLSLSVAVLVSEPRRSSTMVKALTAYTLALGAFLRCQALSVLQEEDLLRHNATTTLEGAESEGASFLRTDAEKTATTATSCTTPAGLSVYNQMKEPHRWEHNPGPGKNIELNSVFYWPF